MRTLTTIVLGATALASSFNAYAASRMQEFYNRATRNGTIEEKALSIETGFYNPNLQRQIQPITVPNADYPGSEIQVQTPTDTARQQYLTYTSFTPSQAPGDKATPADVIADTSKYGYTYSSKPPAFIPQINYAQFGETPIYPFVGQQVPGTNDWLVDITPSGKVVPALTTVNFTDFRSMNWPRTRYANVITEAINAPLDHRLTGTQTNGTFDGLYLVTGDVKIPETATATINKGTVFVMNAGRDDNDEWSNPNEILFALLGTVNVDSTVQNPVIFTVDNILPSQQNWWGVHTQNNTNINPHNILIEYANHSLGFFTLTQETTIQNNIIRHNQPKNQEDCWGIVTQECNLLTITGNEIHDHNWGIHTLKANDIITNNLIYSGEKERISNGIHNFELEDDQNNITNNTIVDELWGIEIGASSPNIQNNTLTTNGVGVMFYLLDGPQNPNVNFNNVWNNYTTAYGPLDYAKEEIFGQWEPAQPNGTQNISNDPLFSNPLIKDFQLQPGSPCIDAANPTTAPTTDFEGKPKIGNRDLGAIEYYPDSDNDGIPDIIENILGTNPNIADTDKDGLTDGFEVGYNGTDILQTYIQNPTITYDELTDALNIYSLQDQGTNLDPLNEDTDNDSANDGWELQRGYNPLDPDQTPTQVPASSTVRLIVLGGLLTCFGIHASRKSTRLSKHHK